MEENSFEAEGDRIVKRLQELDPADEKYEKTLNNLEKLLKVKEVNTKRFISWVSRIEPGYVFLSVISLLEVIIVLKFEKFDVLASKAISFVLRPKI